MAGSVKTQGTGIWFIDTTTTATLVKMSSPGGISGLGGAADQIDDTDLDQTDKTFVQGLGNPGQVSIPFALKPADASHKLLFALKQAGTTMAWAIGLSDGTAPPTLTGSNFTFPTTRTFLKFDAYIADVNIDIAGNEVVRGTLTLQRSGVVAPSWKA